MRVWLSMGRGVYKYAGLEDAIERLAVLVVEGGTDGVALVSVSSGVDCRRRLQRAGLEILGSS